jgi:hypothetical protein
VGPGQGTAGSIWCGSSHLHELHTSALNGQQLGDCCTASWESALPGLNDAWGVGCPMLAFGLL